MTDTFNPDTFLDTDVKADFSDKYVPIPPGRYIATIDEAPPIVRMTKDGPVVNIKFVIDDPELTERLNIRNPSAVMSIWPDLESDGSLSVGVNKNVKLGRLRAALGQNDAKRAWNWNHLRGAGPVLVDVYSQTSDKDPGMVYNKVNRAYPVS